MRYRDPRFPADIGVSIFCGSEGHFATLINISTTGARIELPARLPQDTLVTFQRFTERMTARVVWSNDHQTGVRFEMLLSQAQVNALRGAVVKASFARGASGHRFRELS